MYTESSQSSSAHAFDIYFAWCKLGTHDRTHPPSLPIMTQWTPFIINLQLRRIAVFAMSCFLFANC